MIVKSIGDSILTIKFILGRFLLALAIMLIVPMLIDFYYNDDNWYAFLATIIVTAITSLVLMFNGNAHELIQLRPREAFLVTTLSWLFIAFFSSLPFVLSDLHVSFTNGYFEAVSGLTTTGSTIFSNLGLLSKGLLFWRTLTQWIGGGGIIVMGIIILPMIKAGGMQLFKMESSDNSQNVMPNYQQLAVNLTKLYIFLSVCCAFFLWLAGMDVFDAVTHSMATMATGGFSNYDNSIAYFDSNLIIWIISIFMLMASLPFVSYIQLVNGNYMKIVDNQQIFTFFKLVIVSCLLIYLYCGLHRGDWSWQSVTNIVFSVLSIVSTTGFIVEDYSLWGPFVVVFVFVIGFLGGCTGSTAGGLKMFRIDVVSAALAYNFRKKLNSNAIFVMKYGKKDLDESLMFSTFTFIIIYYLTWLCSATLISITGVDFVTALSGAATAIANVGPGLGNIIGPVGNFSTLPALAKWIISVTMLLGRLEIYTMLILLMPSFWRE